VRRGERNISITLAQHKSSTTREDYADYYEDNRKYFTVDSFYNEFAKSWQDRDLPMAHQPDPDGIEVYRLWRKINQS